MKLYVANCTKQIMNFVYRVPGLGKLHEQKIMPGTQEVIYKPDMSSEIANYIIRQHERYGMVVANEVSRAKAFVGACYSIDTPVDVDKIMSAAKINDKVLIAQGQEFRKNAAVALSDALNSESGGGVNNLTLITKEEPKVGQDAEMGEETITVVDQRRAPRGNVRRKAG